VHWLSFLCSLSNLPHGWLPRKVLEKLKTSLKDARLQEVITEVENRYPVSSSSNQWGIALPLLAGSSMPVTWRVPGTDIPLGAKVTEAVMVGVESFDGIDFDAQDAMQSRLERRKGGRLGVKAVQLLEGDDVWVARAAGLWSDEPLSSALSRSKHAPLSLDRNAGLMFLTNWPGLPVQETPVQPRHAICGQLPGES
jgi:hypothetical protein